MDYSHHSCAFRLLKAARSSLEMDISWASLRLKSLELNNYINFIKMRSWGRSLTSESDHKYNIKLFSLLTETEVVVQRRYKFVRSNNSSLISGGFWPLLTRHKYMAKALNDNDKNNGRQATNSPVTVRLRIVHGTKSPVTTSSTAYRIGVSDADFRLCVHFFMTS